MNLSSDQISQLNQLKAYLKQKGLIAGTPAYKAAWGRASKIITDDNAFNAEVANANKILNGPPALSGKEKFEAVAKGIPQLVAGSIAAEMPKNWGEAAGAAAMLGIDYAFPPAESLGLLSSAVRLAARVGGPPIVAGATAYETAKDPSQATANAADAASQAGIQTILGEGLAQGWNLAGKKGAELIQSQNAQRFAKWIAKHIPGYSGELKTTADIFNAFRSSNRFNMVDELSDKLDQTEQKIGTAFGGRKTFDLPNLVIAAQEAGLPIPNNGLYSFEEATNVMKQLNKRAWAYSGDPKTDVASRELRPLVHNAIQEMGDYLDRTTGTDMGSNWLAMRRQESGSLLLRRMLREKELGAHTGILNNRSLQNLTLVGGNEGYADDFTRIFGQAPTEELQSTVTGLPPNQLGSAVDNPSKGGLASNVRIYAHSLERPPSIGFHPTNLEERAPKYSGDWRRSRRLPMVPRWLRGPVDVGLAPLGRFINEQLQPDSFKKDVPDLVEEPSDASK